MESREIVPWDSMNVEAINAETVLFKNLAPILVLAVLNTLQLTAIKQEGSVVLFSSLTANDAITAHNYHS